MNPIGSLLDGLIDYAGLFPPAALDMPAAVRQYAEYRNSRHGWALGRFIVPLARLDEMRRAASAFADAAEWKLSVLALPGNSVPAEIDSVEMKVERAADIAHLSATLPALRYFEIPIANDPQELVLALAATGSRAKVRTGGLTPESYPGAAELTRFICACAEARVPFKATAGLHHPLPSPPMHGFVNVFLAAALAWQGGSREEVAATLEEPAWETFSWEEGAVAWQDHRLSTAQIAAARAEFAVAFGSCSFEEPIGDLEALGWL